MIFAAVLAGGIGKRMGNVDKPKQFLMIGKKPIIVHTVEQFCIHDKFEKIIVLCPKQWMPYTKDLLDKYLGQTDRVCVIEGGDIRNQTIMNAIDWIESNYGLEEDTVLVTHDAVRPFVTSRIIEDNILAATKYGACDTVVPATDTIVQSDDEKCIANIPERSKFWHGQTPQSFLAVKFKELYESLTEEEKGILTDAAKVFVMKGEKVRMVEGENFNIKVTYPYDLQLAETLLEGDK